MISRAVSGLPEGRRLRVVEVGAGTGGVTGAVLAALPAGRVDYLYTDISAGFFSEAEGRFRESGARLEVRTLDIERDPGEQGFELHRADVVLAANVLHATRDLEESLLHCRRLLSPSGLLVVLESLESRSWLDLTFGLLPGWWRFEDAYRTDQALVGPAVWRRALSESGYGEVSIVGSERLSSGEEVATSGVIVARAPAELGADPGLWAVWPAGGEGAADLIRELTDRGQRVVSASGVEAGDRDSWRSFFAGLSAEGPLSGVVHLGAVSGHGVDATGEELAGDITRIGSSALALTQGLQDAGASPVSGLWFVTRGGQVVGEECGGDLSGSVLWGFGQTAAQELRGIPVRVVDVDPLGDFSAREVAEELLYPDRENGVAWRDGRRQGLRLVRRKPRASVAALDRIRGDRSYLVTGGLGGLGMAVAGWLRERGAGAIVLNGRREPGPGVAAQVERLRGSGAEVRVSLADVSDADAVARLVRESGSEGGLPPLGGVIHSVGVLADALLVNQDWESFERVLWPKALGAWHLHRATLELDLDLFVVFSSFSATVGNRGQANYAGANTFLDQLALHRRSLGLAGQTIQWGAWSGIGEAAEQRERIEARLEASGMHWLSPVQGLEAFGRLVGEDAASTAVVAADWSVLSEQAEFRPSLLAELVEERRRAAPAGVVGQLVTQLRETPEVEREQVVVDFVREEVRSVLRLSSAPPAEVGFFDLGMDSLMAVELRNRVNRALSGEYTAPNTLVFDYPNAGKLGRHLLSQLGDLAVPIRVTALPAVSSRGYPRIAVVGMACRFPGGEETTAFWRQLEAGEGAITKGRPDALMAGAPGETDAFGAYLSDLDGFDAEFFRIAPVEAEMLDPQQRLLLEMSWAALEDAGMNPERLQGSRTGVYVGIGSNDYQRLIGDAAFDFYAASGTSFATAIGRISFVLGLEGPAMAVDTACSSSLVAIHQAIAGLERGEADLALVGGVNAILTAVGARALGNAGMLAADGRCKTFDASADGYVRGEGCGMLVLKPLPEAERDGDRILAVLLGSAVNQDGASAGLTVPNGPAQERVIRAALDRAGVEPSTVDYLEAHGTGTELGDPIEIQAAAAVYGQGRPPDHPLLVGSVKTNIGHLEAAAGVAGVIKVLLAMREGLLPKHLHFERPNPRMDWERLPVRVTSEATVWPENPDRPVRAAVSSFGFSGTNAHLVLESYEAPVDDAGAAVGVAPHLEAAQAEFSGGGSASCRSPQELPRHSASLRDGIWAGSARGSGPLSAYRMRRGRRGWGEVILRIVRVSCSGKSMTFGNSCAPRRSPVESGRRVRPGGLHSSTRVRGASGPVWAGICMTGSQWRERSWTAASECSARSGRNHSYR